MKKNTDLQGLSQQEVVQRRAAGQGNDFDLGVSRSYLEIIRYNFFTFINLVLFGIGFVLLAMNLPGDALATAGLVVINVTVGVVQEIRAKRKLDRIALLTRPKVTALRDSEEQIIDPNEIVLGDFLVIRPGDQAVVDGLVIETDQVEMDESLLTGESDLVAKDNGDTIFSGSFCVTGQVIYETTKVGAESFANKMTARARNFEVALTPLQRDINFIVRLLALVSSSLGLLVYLAAVRESSPAEDTVQSLAVITGLIPQGLIFLTTLSYALGALRMVGRGALIQQSSAIESMSNIDVLCLDKTGTITTNTIKLSELYPLDADEAGLKRALGAFVASVTTTNRTSMAIHDELKGQPVEVIEEVPFSSARKWSALALDEGDLKGTYIMGAPEILAPYLAEGSGLSSRVDEWTAQGWRVILFAMSPQVHPLKSPEGEITVPANLRPLGLIALTDELRPYVEDTLNGFTEAGVELKIISGDNPQAVAALARQVAFPVQGDELKMVTGLELAHLSDGDFARVVEKTNIFGRITPDQKERIIRTLQDNGNYVAMIGDGINDVLSLKRAQVGIALQSGSPISRNVAEIVLLDDSFAVLPDAFMEGQRIINGMQDIVRILLARTFYMVFLIVAAALVRVNFPLEPKFDTLIATITVGIPGPALAAWARPGKPARSTLKAMVHFVFPAALTIAALGLGIYLYFLESSGEIQIARTASTICLVSCGLLLLPFVEPPTSVWVGGDEYSGDWRPTLVALALALGFGIMLVVPDLQNAFELVPLSSADYLIIFLGILAWGGILRLIWVTRAFERFLSMEL